MASDAKHPAHIKVRPFRENFRSPSRGTSVTLAGSVAGQAFKVIALGREVALRTVATDTDERGEFAIVLEGEYALAGRIILRVQPDYEPDMPPGGDISVDLPGDREATTTDLASAGIDIDEVNVIVPTRRSLSVAFDSDGNVHGRSVVGDDYWAEPAR